MTDFPESVWRTFRRGAEHGVFVWLIYTTVEVLFSAVFLKQAHGFGYTAPDIRTTLALLFVYPSIGFLLGGCAALGFRALNVTSPRWRAASLGALLGWVLVFSAHLVYALEWRANVLLLSVCTFLAGAALLSLQSELWSRRLVFITNPWTASLLVLGIGSLTKELLVAQPTLTRIAAAGAYSVLLLLLSYGILRQLGTAWRRPSLRWVVLAMVCAISIGAAVWVGRDQPLIVLANNGGQPSRPNIILLVMDTVRADHLSVYNYARDTTPQLRSIAERATLYTNAISSGDMTLSSHASMFTGLYPSEHGAHAEPDSPVPAPLDRRFQTLAEILSNQGYATMAVVANYGFLGREFQLDQGFQYFNPLPPVLGKLPEFYLRRTVRDFIVATRYPGHTEPAFRRAKDVNGKALPLIEKAVKAKKPFFLFLNYMDAHGWYTPPTPYDRLFPGKDVSLQPKLGDIIGEVMSMRRPLSKHERDHLISQYDGGIAYLDQQIGLLAGKLQRAGILDQALLIITSDHGEAFGRRQLMWHGNALYQNEVHVPLIIKYPGQTEKQVSSQPAGSVDLLPTILEVAGIRPPGTEGHSLLHADPNRVVFSETFPYPQLLAWNKRFDRISRAAVSGSRKLILSTKGERELYNLDRDPAEQANVYKRNEAQNLEAELIKFGKASNQSDREVVRPDKATIDRLRSLGYVQ